MKLMLKIPTATPRLVKVRLHAGLVELLEDYLDYCKMQVGQSITLDQVLLEIITVFIKSDRDFARWKHGRVTHTNIAE